MQHLTHDELHKLLTQAKRHSERNWLMLLVAYWHGLRASEVLDLRADNFTDKDITVQRLHGSGKTTQPLIRHPQALLNEADAIPKRLAEVGTGRLFPITRNQLWKLMQEYGAAAGIAPEKLKLHALKHSIAIHGLPEARLPVKYLTWDELRSLVAEARRDSERNWLMLLLTYWHGLRVSEVVSLRAENFSKGYITVQRLHGSRKTTQPLVRHPDSLFNEADAVQKRIAEVGNERLFPITRNQAWRIIQKYGIAAGIELHKLHPHVLKHSIVIHGLPEAGIENVRRYLGHAYKSSTGDYLRSSHAPGKLQRAAEKSVVIKHGKAVPKAMMGCPKHPGAEFYKNRQCKECAREKRRRYHAEHGESLQSKFNGFLNQARLRGLPVAVSFEQWKQLKVSPCAYRIDDTNCPVGIDRKDNEVGYTPENCIACCSLHNRIKGDVFTYEQMLQIVDQYQIRCGQIRTGRKRIVIPQKKAYPPSKVSN